MICRESYECDHHADRRKFSFGGFIEKVMNLVSKKKVINVIATLTQKSYFKTTDRESYEYDRYIAREILLWDDA